MLTAPRKINSTLVANFMCLRQAVREIFTRQREQTNKQIHKLFAL